MKIWEVVFLNYPYPGGKFAEIEAATPGAAVDKAFRRYRRAVTHRGDIPKGGDFLFGTGCPVEVRVTFLREDFPVNEGGNK